MADYGHIPGGGRPYGDIFYVQTPALDRMTQQLYQEQKQREILRQRQAAALDDEFSKNVAGIRDADVPELTKLYGDWKVANQSAMKKREGVSPEEQLQLLRKKGEMYKKIAESKAGLLEEEDLRKGIQKDPDTYDDNASTYLAVRRRTPLSQLDAYKDEKGSPINLRDYNTYRYKGTNTDFQKILTTAAGTPRQVFQKEEPVDKNNMQFKITPYLYGNTPAQFKESVLSSLSLHKAGRDAEAMISQVDPQVIRSVDQEFKAIPLERWRQMGVDNPQDLVIRNADSKAEKFATHQAQLYALNNLPKEGAPIFRDNKAAIKASDQAFDLKKLAIQHANAVDLVNRHHELTQGDKALEGLWIDEYVDKVTDNAKQGELFDYKFKDGSKVSGYKIALDPTINKALGFNEKNPGTLIATNDGQYIIAPYKTDKDYKPLIKDGVYTVDTERASKVSADQLKLAMGKTAGVKQLNKEMSAPAKNHQPVSGSKKVYKGLDKDGNPIFQ